jgi:putative colanic acid biosysnthesis UDP-glucose lipid carrier transferase
VLNHELRANNDYSTVEKILACALLILLAPTMAAITIAIKLESPGPVLSKKRVGYANGNPVFVWRFRTDRLREPVGGPQPAGSTCVGRFLRTTDLDLLPQLINVAFGSMPQNKREIAPR